MLVADEAVSALDVSVQAQILTLIKDIQQRLGLAILFITHDLRVAAQICDRIAVMQRGRIVETGPTAALFAAPAARPTPRRLLAAAFGTVADCRSSWSGWSRPSIFPPSASQTWMLGTAGMTSSSRR